MSGSRLVLAGLLAVSLGAAAEPDAKVQRLWKAKCGSCHGADGKGKTETGAKLGIPDFTTPAWQKQVSAEEAKKAITDGFTRPGKSEGMDAYKDKLEPDQIDALVAYVKALK